MRLRYDDLVRDYLDSLHSKLRNFSVEPEFLATWVHDEDDATSLYEIFAAAREAGCRDLTVAVGTKSVARVDRAALEKRLAPLGSIRIEALGDGSWDVVAALSDKPPKAAPAAASMAKPRPAAPRPAAPKPAAPTAAGRLAGTHPAYRAALAKLAADIRLEGHAPSAPAGGLVVEAGEGQVRLAVAVDAAGVVSAATHMGAAGDLRSALEGLCSLLPGRPFREANDHAVIRLESKLRDRSVPAPTIGLVTPRNADPLFAAPEKMLRSAYRDWALKTNARPGWNYWDDQPAASWLALSAADRLARAKAAVHDGCRELGVYEGGVEILEILNDCRLVLAATPETLKPTFAPLMMRLERRVKELLDPRIELQLESLEDRNRRAQRTDRTDKLV